jgi:hypothetical protein
LFENAKNVKDNDDHAFVICDGAHFKNTCKWIMDLEAAKHIILHRVTFDMHKLIVSRNVYLDDDSVVEAIEWDLSM